MEEIRCDRSVIGSVITEGLNIKDGRRRGSFLAMKFLVAENGRNARLKRWSRTLSRV